MTRERIFFFLNRFTFGKLIINQFFNKKFSTSAEYWENRYQKNGTSGNGSYGDLAIYKAKVLNEFVAGNAVQSVVELGCGDGNQLKQFNFPQYCGFDISKTVIAKCRQEFSGDETKKFLPYPPVFDETQYDLALSLDVIYHLIEDDVYETYMSNLFSVASRFVVIYAWDTAELRTFHVRHRKFSDWIAVNAPGWKLNKQLKDTTGIGACDFFFYEKT